MKVLVSGSTGLIGRALVAHLQERGDEAVRLLRHPGPFPEPAVYWRPEAGELDAGVLSGLDAVVHLAGENIAGGRWTASRKALIRDSRVQSTELLARRLRVCASPPRVFVCASAIGYYGSRGDEFLTEESAPGTGFLAGVCRAWEAAAQSASEAEIRVVNMRFGAVLAREGGALTKLLTPFRLGLGGVIGNGRQWMSWVSIDDAVRAIAYVVENSSVSGPVNVVSPEPVTNKTFAKEMGRVLHRPTLFPLPAFAARLALGEMADEVLLASARVQPARLLDNGFSFLHADLRGTLNGLLGG